MTGEKNLEKLLETLQPVLLPGEFVFCTVGDRCLGDMAVLQPIASYLEDEGQSLVLNRQVADEAGLCYDSVFSCIKLAVHSSLDAVGLTAAVSSRLANNGISANVIAAYFHDYIYVHKEKADDALRLLVNL